MKGDIEEKVVLPAPSVRLLAIATSRGKGVHITMAPGPARDALVGRVRGAAHAADAFTRSAFTSEGNDVFVSFRADSSDVFPNGPIHRERQFRVVDAAWLALRREFYAQLAAPKTPRS